MNEISEKLLHKVRCSPDEITKARSQLNSEESLAKQAQALPISEFK